MTDERKWYETRDNLIRLAWWLDDMGYFSNTSRLLYFFEKPWKWTREWELYLAWLETDDATVRQRLVDAIDTDETAEEVLAGSEDD